MTYSVVLIAVVQESDSLIYIYIYIYIQFFIFLYFMVYHRIINIAPCAIQKDLAVYSSYA